MLYERVIAGVFRMWASWRHRMGAWSRMIAKAPFPISGSGRTGIQDRTGYLDALSRLETEEAPKLLPLAFASSGELISMLTGILGRVSPPALDLLFSHVSPAVLMAALASRDAKEVARILHFSPARDFIEYWPELPYEGKLQILEPLMSMNPQMRRKITPHLASSEGVVYISQLKAATDSHHIWHLSTYSPGVMYWRDTLNALRSLNPDDGDQRDPRIDLMNVSEAEDSASGSAVLADGLDQLFRRLGPPPDHLHNERSPLLHGGGGTAK
ncbi:hypothetical protein [Sphaerisporangium rhizosphaerae]|uniref:Uncharacterized protein n=1 Tax=Sphaerisporangium rhizosphaerae TaxID=2269375 RepID=A0ABW2NUK4_9ACTN